MDDSPDNRRDPPTAAPGPARQQIRTSGSSQASNGTVYANLPFPIYQSGTGFTSGTDGNFAGVIETSNGNPDGDTVINPTSHEVSEAIT